MSEAKHTPTPWVVYEGSIVVDESKTRTICVCAHASEANAAFIVKACNAHDGLVAALRDAIDSLEYVERMHPGLSGYGVRHERIAAARAALAAGTMTAPTVPEDSPSA